MKSERDDDLNLKIAMVQMDVALGNKEKNKETILRLTKDFPDDCDFLVLPELWNIGYDREHIKEKAETLNGESVDFLRKLAKDKNVDIIGGSIAELQENSVYNTMPMINRHGELISKYRKVHLFPLVIDEPSLFKEGDDWGLYSDDRMTFGTMICYDLRFPAFCRNLALRGASLLFVPAQWPKARIHHYQTLLQARAIENQMHVIGVNRCGSDYVDYSGGSMVISPNGTILAECGSGEELKICEIDMEDRRSMRKMIPVFHDRRNILDEIDDNLF